MANAQANTTTTKTQTPREMFMTGNTELFTAVLSLDKIHEKKSCLMLNILADSEVNMMCSRSKQETVI